LKISLLRHDSHATRLARLMLPLSQLDSWPIRMAGSKLHRPNVVVLLISDLRK
jgi:hypothetical protein